MARPPLEQLSINHTMKKLLFVALLGFLMSCSKSPYDSLSGQFPVIDQFPHEFKFSENDLPAPIETELIEGTIRPIGKVEIDGDRVMLVSNNFVEGEAPWGDLTGHIFKNGEKGKDITLASDFSQSYIWSSLDADLKLSVYTSVMDDTGEEREEVTTLDLKAE